MQSREQEADRGALAPERRAAPSLAGGAEPWSGAKILIASAKAPDLVPK